CAAAHRGGSVFFVAAIVEDWCISYDLGHGADMGAFIGRHDLHALRVAAALADVRHRHADQDTRGGDAHDLVVVLDDLSAHDRAVLLRDLHRDEAEAVAVLPAIFLQRRALAEAL